MIWKGTSNGIFSIIRAYHLRMEIQARGKGGSSNSNIGEDLWPILWGLKTPNVIKVFMWRACNNLLPTKVNLFHRRVVSDKVCPLCGVDEEIVIHALWSCPAAQDVWSCGQIFLQKRCSWGDCFVQMVSNIFSLCNLEEAALTAGIARKIWFRRNSGIHAGTFTHPNQVLRDAVVESEEYKICALENLDSVAREEPSSNGSIYHCLATSTRRCY